MPLEINAQFRKFVEFAQQRANPATSKAIARAGDEEPLGGRAIKAAAVAVAAVALASCAQVPGDAGANADAARGLRFGHWPTNSTESIEWRVLEERGGRALLLADRVLDARPFHGVREPVVWADSDLRAWLNGPFLETAFTAQERGAIVESALEARPNPRFDTPPGRPTHDRVFLLSYEECLRAFPEDARRVCLPTEFAVANGCYTNVDGHAAWWLRSNGMSETEPEHLATWGNFSLRHHHVDDPIIGVRPALWIDCRRKD